MNIGKKQTQDSVESFEWQWIKKKVRDSRKNFYRRLFRDVGIFANYFDNKVVGYFGSGGGRHVWAINELSNPKKIISVELAENSVAYQKTYMKSQKIEIIQGDMATVNVKVDFLYLVGVIQHTSSIEKTLKNALSCLNIGGELVVSFYLWTPATILLEPVRQIMKRLPRKIAWFFSYFLAPIYMIRRAGREAGYMNAVHSAYDWNGSQQYQHYMTTKKIEALFNKLGINVSDIIDLKPKGLYRIKKHLDKENLKIDDIYFEFGDVG
mgnify:FL=1